MQRCMHKLDLGYACVCETDGLLITKRGSIALVELDESERSVRSVLIEFFFFVTFAKFSREFRVVIVRYSVRVSVSSSNAVYIS